MSHTPVSQRLCRFVKKSFQNASKEEVLGFC